MIFPTETPLTVSVGTEGGNFASDQAKVAVLETAVEWMRWCSNCETEQRFVAEMECAIGLIGHCSNCGEEKIAPYTRTVGEAS
jgi:hypothetical protein